MNRTGDMSYTTRVSGKGSVLIEIRNVEAGIVCAEIDTRASCYQKFYIDWISERDILLDSSDIGYKVIHVDDNSCKVFWAQVSAMHDEDDRCKVTLFDEDKNPTGLTIYVSAGALSRHRTSAKGTQVSAYE